MHLGEEGDQGPFYFGFDLNNLWMHSSNTDHLMFKKLLINKFRVILIEVFIIRFNHYTVFPMYNQDNAQHLKRKKTQSIAPTSKKAFYSFWDAAIQYLYKHLHTVVNTEVLHVMQHYG